MAYLTDPTEEELLQQQIGASAPAGAGPSTPGTAAPVSAPSSGQGFAPLQAYFGANQGKANEMADGLAGGLEQQSYDAIAAGDVGAAESLMPQLDAAASNPGRASLFAEDAGPGYTAGMGGLDAYLAGAAQPERFAGLRDAFGGGLNEVGMPPPDDTRDVPLEPQPEFTEEERKKRKDMEMWGREGPPPGWNGR
jgi:hypothetical protein